MRSLDPLRPGEKRKLTLLRVDLLRWARDHGRDFPWRREQAGVYEKVVVEVLLQRTTATAVAGFYDRFIAAYPGWHALAGADAPDLEAFLKPLGLWRRRAASLLGLARYAAGTGGTFPADPAAHADIPAVGQYVSSAICVFQHGQARPLLDVNMARVIERFVRPRRLADIRHDPWLQAAARWYARGADVAAANWAMLDFAAAICRARRPACEVCPVRSRCSYFSRTSQDCTSGSAANPGTL